VPLLTSAEQSAQRRRLPTKTVVQQREADTRRIPLFLCDKFRAVSYFFCVSRLCSASD